MEAGITNYIWDISDILLLIGKKYKIETINPRSLVGLLEIEFSD